MSPRRPPDSEGASAREFPEVEGRAGESAGPSLLLFGFFGKASTGEWLGLVTTVVVSLVLAECLVLDSRSQGVLA